MTQTRRLAVVLALNVVLVLGLAEVGVTVGSVALLAASGDGIADTFALVLSIIAVHVRDRHGISWATTAVALINVLVLLVVSAGLLTEGIDRLIVGAPPLPGVPVLIAALAAAVLMGAGAAVLERGAAHEDIHMRSVLLDTAGDAIAALGVAASGAIIAIVHGLFWLDAAVGVLIGLLVAVLALRLLAQVIRALRDQTPIPIENP